MSKKAPALETHVHSLVIGDCRWLVVALVIAASSGACVARPSEAVSATVVSTTVPILAMPAAPSPTPTPEPIVLPAGREARPLMPGAPQETPQKAGGRPGRDSQRARELRSAPDTRARMAHHEARRWWRAAATETRTR